MEHYHAIALTFLRPALSPELLQTLYRSVGSATDIVEHCADIADIVPNISTKILQSVTEGMDAALKRAAEEMAFCEKHSIRVLIPSDDDYPRRMDTCADAPLVLYYRGTADLNARRTVSIIGTRKCTVYGQDLIRRLVQGLKATCPDTIVVSGLAYGVDINAHRNALEQGMETIGIVAHGMDMIYPSLHRETAKKMLFQGGLLTEYPSHTIIDKRNFLHRNRIVAALGDACVLPESASHGGGLVTCRLSHDYGRRVFAYPGPVTSEYSQGCNNLIRDHGAELITEAADLTNAMGWDNDIKLLEAQKKGIERTLFPDLTPAEQNIVEALRTRGDLLPDQLVESTGLPITEVKSSLFMMEMNGIVKTMPGNFYHLLD